MYPILGRTRWFFIYSYTAVFGVGLLISIGFIYWRVKKTAVFATFDTLLAGLTSGLLLGRLTFISLQRQYYLERPDALGNIWQGGFNLHATLIGALIGMAAWATLQKRPLRPYLDLLIPLIPLLFFFGWTACLLEGCAYGAETTLSPFSANLPDDLGVYAVRYQTQLGGMLGSGLLFAVGWLMSQRGENGRFSPLIFPATFILHALITHFRGDPARHLLTLRLDTLLDLIVAASAPILLQYSQNSPKKESPHDRH